jgi:hypothetical protein
LPNETRHDKRAHVGHIIFAAAQGDLVVSCAGNILDRHQACRIGGQALVLDYDVGHLMGYGIDDDIGGLATGNITTLHVDIQGNVCHSAAPIACPTRQQPPSLERLRCREGIEAVKDFDRNHDLASIH